MLLRALLLIMMAALPAFSQVNVTDNRAMRHTFPQITDGTFPDGTSYRSTLLITTDTEAAGCLFTLFGLTIPGVGDGITLAVSIADHHVFRQVTPGTQPFQSGYATLVCSAPVTAQVIYTYVSEGGKVLSEATVFSAPPATTAQIPLDIKPGTFLGIALVNNSDFTRQYVVSVGPGLQTLVSVPPHTRIARFVNELIPVLPALIFGAVQIYPTSPIVVDNTFAIGLRFTGTAFTTLPATEIH